MPHTIYKNRLAVPRIGRRLPDKLWSELIKGLIFFQQMREIGVRTADGGVTRVRREGAPRLCLARLREGNA